MRINTAIPGPNKPQNARLGRSSSGCHAGGRGFESRRSRPCHPARARGVLLPGLRSLGTLLLAYPGLADSTERAGATPQRPSREPLRAYVVMRTVHALQRLAFRPMSSPDVSTRGGSGPLVPRIHPWAMTSREGVGLYRHEP